MEIKLSVMTMRFVFAIALLTLFSCGNKKLSRVKTVPNGTYKGQFIRSSPLAKYASSNITITFKGNTFSGESDKSNYPAICKGTFKVMGNTIELENDCLWTADFDWSYILKGTFEYTMTDGKLEMTRSLDDNTDHYSLQLQ